MKKILRVVVLTALGGLAVSTFADVQNIRISGDVRLRGYYLNNAGADLAGGTYQQTSGDTQLFEQRTRVSLEADLADHVLVVTTLRVDGIWGQTAGLGFAPGSKTWTSGVDEAYLQLSELFASPATLKVGRQYLNYGTGLIISSFDEDYNFDAGRLVLDYQPMTIDLVMAQLVNGQTFMARPVGGQSDLLFLNAKYDVRGSAVKDVEGYFGWASQTASHPHPFGLDTNGPAPMIVGLRTDLTPAKGLTVALEGAYELGGTGLPAGDAKNLSAFLAKATVKYSLQGMLWAPAVNAAYTFAGGGGSSGRHDFVPWFDMVDGYNGYAFAPALSNIQIFNLGASVKPCANTALALQGYYYLRTDRGSDVYSNPNADIGGPAFVKTMESAIGAGSATAGILNSHDLGWEADAILGYDYSKDVRCQLVYGVFIPNNHSFQGVASHIVDEVRAELTVKF